jgi:CHAT domain-containing protein
MTITEPEGEDVSEGTWTDDEVKTLTGYLGERTVAAIEPELARLRAIEAAAREVVQIGASNLTQPLYNARMRAFDALRAALSEVPSDG